MKLISLFCNLIHADAGVAFIVHTFTIFYQKYLWRFMVHGKVFGNFTRDISVFDQVKKVKINILRWGIAFQPAFGNTAHSATGTVFKDNLCLEF